jgi:hypothetical protein
MVTSNSYKNDSGEDSQNFSDPEDYEDNISNEGNFTIRFFWGLGGGLHLNSISEYLNLEIFCFVLNGNF